jgi:ankyrin repeat protein
VFKQTNLQIAAARGHEGVVKALLERKSVLKDIDLSSCKDDTFWNLEDSSEHEFWSYGTALHFAFLSNKGSTEVIKALIRAGADVEAQNSQNQRPRDMAIRAGREDDLKVLDTSRVRKGASDFSLGDLVQA